METQINNNLSWQSVCVIGLGSHAKNKLIPGLVAAGLQLEGIVSRSSSLAFSGVQTYLTIADAISCLPMTTLFVIASPPNAHYAQAKAVIEAGRDVFIEKPAFLSFNEAAELNRLATQNGVVLVEMLMYLENNSVQQIIGEINRASLPVKNIDCHFLIPSVPSGTFRTELSLGNSLLSDMGCYPLSMLAIAGYDLSNLDLISEKFHNKQSLIFYIEGKAQQTNIHIQVGTDCQYRNKIKVEFEDNKEISCEPFFYGREGYRTITKLTKSGELVKRIFEYNSYEVMFLKKRSVWLKTQKSRLNALNIVSKSLERLGRQSELF